VFIASNFKLARKQLQSPSADRSLLSLQYDDEKGSLCDLLMFFSMHRKYFMFWGKN
jgi:hypothetical protein